MSSFWGYPYADVLATVMIIALSALALYQARTYVRQI